MYAVLLGPLWTKLAYDWAHYALIQPAVTRVALWYRMREARKQLKNVKRLERMEAELRHRGQLK